MGTEEEERDRFDDLMKQEVQKIKIQECTVSPPPSLPFPLLPFPLPAPPPRPFISPSFFSEPQGLFVDWGGWVVGFRGAKSRSFPHRILLGEMHHQQHFE